MIEPRDLITYIVPLVYVVEEGSFRAAAQRLGLTPAAVSKAVSRLEEQLGVRLLHRTTRRVSLSREGALFVERCQEAIRQVQAGRDLVAMAQQSAEGRLTVSLSQVFGRVLCSRLARFVERFPKLELDLRFTDRESRLVDEQVDIALRIGELADSSLMTKRVFTTRWATVASPSYLGRYGTPATPADLDTHRCLCFRTPHGTVAEWAFQSPAGPTIMLKCDATVFLDQGELMVESAISGVGICQAFLFLVEDALRDGRLVEVLADYQTSGPPVHALFLPGQQQSPRVRAFLDFLLEIFGPSAGYSR